MRFPEMWQFEPRVRVWHACTRVWHASMYQERWRLPAAWATVQLKHQVSVVQLSDHMSGQLGRYLGLQAI
jgi:hypothetical protein